MRRTTICHSDGARLAAVALLVMGVAPLAAQQPSVIQRPIQQARETAAQASAQVQQQQQAGQQPAQAAQRPAGQQQPAVQGGQVTGATPQTHTVQQGETLWGLAQQLFGDPLLWPEIYRLNTDVVEDPHWIFPGEELRLVPAEPVAAAPAAAEQPTVAVVTPAQDSTPAPAPVAARNTDAPTIFAPRPQAAIAEQVQVQEDRTYRAVREGEYYSSGFIADSRVLEAGELVRAVEQSALRRLATRESVPLFGSVVVTPPAGQAYRRDDLLLAWVVDRGVTGYGDLIRPLGLLRVTADGETDQSTTATVTALFAELNTGARLLKVPPFRYTSSARAEPTDSGVEGQVIAARRPSDVVNLQDVLYINRGSDEGVHLGDVFRISSPVPSTGAMREQAEALVVNTQPTTSSVVVLQITQPDIRPGATARQVRRMPS